MIILKHEIFSKIKDPYAFYVLMAGIANHASFDDKKESFPSINTISKETGISKSKVIESLKTLQEIGFLKIDKIKSKNNEYYCNHYEITTNLVEVTGKLKFRPNHSTDDEGLNQKTCACAFCGGIPDTPATSKTVSDAFCASPSGVLGGVPHELRVVREMESNHKTNITTRPYNPTLNSSQPPMASCSEVRPPATPTESLTVSQLSVGINPNGVTTIVSHTEENNSNNNLFGENCLDSKVTPARPSSTANQSNAKLSIDTEEEFEKVWKLYPLKVNKNIAKKKYLSLVKKNPKLIQAIQEGLKPIVEFAELTKTEEFKATNYNHAYLHFSTWLHNNMWDEDFVEAIKQKVRSWNKNAYPLVVNWFENKTSRSTSPDQSEPVQKTEPAPSQSDYLNMINNMYNL